MKRLRHNVRLMALLMAGLFIGLATYFSYSVYFYGGRWFASANNPRLSAQKQTVVAGDITDRTGRVLATTQNGERTYPTSSEIRHAVSHVVGDSGGIVANGAETFLSSYLLGFKASAWERIQSMFTGGPTRGDNIQLSINASLCAFAREQLANYSAGAIVVLNYKTGEVIVSNSYPDFSPRDMDATKNAKEDNGAFVNRATQGMYPPGSTFKIVTMAAALSNLSDVADRTFDCTGSLLVDKTTVTEASNLVHGTLSMRDAFAKSCNTTFSSIALELGYSRLNKTAQNFGFNSNFLFRDMVVYNSQFPTNNPTRDDLAWAGVGQGRVLATPLHMAMIAGAIANDGVMMEPRMLLSATTPLGAQRVLIPEKVYTRACDPSVAQTIKDYMIRCVEAGTGTRAQIKGIKVAGKTGSAEVSDNKSVPTHAWFVGFIDDARYPYAIAVVVEKGGAGGSVAAPIARKILEKVIEAQ